MKTKKHTKVMALALSLLLLLTTFVSIPFVANAATETIDIELIDYPRGGGTSTWGHPALHFMNGWNISSSNHFSAKAAANKNWQVAYCVQPNVPLNSNDKSPEILPETFLDGYNNGALNAMEIQKLLGRIFQYGYTGRVTTTLTNDEISEMQATQLLVWETIVGERDSAFGHIAPPSNLDAVLQTIRSDHPNRALILSHYNRIVASVANHSKIPSFLKTNTASATVNNMTWDGSAYSVTLTDTNGVLGNFTFSGSGLTFSVSGNQLTIKATTAPSGPVTIQAVKNNGAVRSAVAFWCSNKIVVKGTVQGLVMSGQNISDPLEGFVKVEVPYGKMEIIKTSKNNGGRVDGFQFKVTKDGNLVGTYTSGTDGRINVPDLMPGWYKVEEINLSEDFVKPTPNPVDVEIKAGQTATVGFSNVKKMGVISVVKTNGRPLMGDYSLLGAEFTVKDSNGNVVDTIVTKADGTGQSKPLPLSVYTIFESKAPYGFVRDKNVYTRTLTGALGTAEVVYCPVLGIPEMPQVGKITITKLDAETATVAQGDATLSHAVFDLFDPAGKFVERLYCGNNTSVTSSEIPLGKGYVIKEVTPPRGYTLSQKEYTVDIEYAGQDVEVNLKSTKVENTVIKGRISIIKHSDDPDAQVDPENPQVQQPLEGITFYVYLKSAGSFDKAKATERDVLVTDANGFATSKLIPYGTYVVSEDPKGAPEHKVCAPFDAHVIENERTYYFNVENPVYTGKVKIVKTDSETGKIIPQAGVEFKVKNKDTGEWVEQEILYPTPIKITNYFTNAEGWLVMPQELRFGNFELWEQQSPYGYLLSEKPVPFKVTAENPVAFLEVKMPNKPAMGQITIEKKGEILVGADKITGKSYTQWIPKYEVSSLAGATFDIIARRDIVTPDGTVRAKAGTVVDTVTTLADGKAQSKLLYLGDYYAIEKSVPVGMVLNTKEFDFSLIYKDQNTPIVFEQISVFNERQKAEVSMEKSCELPENPPEDFNPYEDIVFGLFAREDIKTADGTVAIPKDELLEYITFDKTGKTILNTDLPLAKYYVLEIMCGQAYVLDETQYDFEFAYAGKDKAVVKLAVNDGVPIENRLQRGSLKLIKTFEGKDVPLADIPFHITGQTTVGTTVEIDVVTDENGEINIEGLLVGEYKISELECDLSAGYVLTLDEAFIIAPDEITELTIENKLMRGDLKIIKVFEGKSTPIPGIPFTIIGKTIAGTDYEETHKTDENGEINLTGLLVGEYKIVELSSELSIGYLLSEEETAIVASDEVAEMKINNRLIRGHVRLIKTDSQSGKTLAGAEFELYDPDGNLIGVYISDADGVILVEDLAYGIGYKFIEKKAPNGFKLEKNEITFDITEQGKTIELTATNTPVPDIPKTGDDGIPVWVYVGLILSSAAGLGALVFKRRRKLS